MHASPESYADRLTDLAQSGIAGREGERAGRSRGEVPTIYKICSAELWREAERAGVFAGAPLDTRDGFIHFSTAAQVAETAAKHFAGATGQVLVAVETERLGEALKWEPSRGGALFPHLYAAMRLDAVKWVVPLPLGADGVHVFPELVPP